MALLPDYYEVLQVSPNAEEEIIQVAYRRLAAKWHPDKRPGDAVALVQMKHINEAYEVLSDSKKRHAYDRDRKQPPPATPDCEEGPRENKGDVTSETHPVHQPEPERGYKQTTEPTEARDEEPPYRKHRGAYLAAGAFGVVILAAVGLLILALRNRAVPSKVVNPGQEIELAKSKEITKADAKKADQDRMLREVREIFESFDPKAQKEILEWADEVLDPQIRPLPPNGSTARLVNKEPIAPLEIVTKGDSQHYFLKISDWESNKDVATVFIRGGQTATIKMPLGSYRLKYATGLTWYGPIHLFGKNTSYYKAETRFDFHQIGEQARGWTVELFLQKAGNLRTSKINAEDW